MTATYPTDRGPAPERRNPLVRAMLALEEASVLDRASRLVEPVADALVRSPRRREALQGRWLGHALHPLLVTVPLGTWTSVTLLDVVGGEGSRDAARTLTGFAILTAVPSAVTGLAEWADANRRDRRTATVHAAANYVALAGYAMSWRARRRGDHLRGACLGAASYTVVGASGFLGGHLTQARKVGSHHPAFAPEAVQG